MFSTLPSFDRGGLRFSSLLLVGSTLLAACNNDQPLAPAAKAVPTEASASVGVQSAQLYITIRDENGAAPASVGARFTVQETSNPYLSRSLTRPALSRRCGDAGRINALE